MKFLNKYSENTLRFFIIVISLYALILAGIPIFNSIFTRRLTVDDSAKNEVADSSGRRYLEVVIVYPNGVSEKAGLKPGDKILELNGKKTESLDKFQVTISSISAGEKGYYLVERKGEILQIVIPVYKYFHLIFYIFSVLGLGFLVNGFFVGISKPKELTSQLFFIFGAISSIGFTIYGGVWYYVGSESFLMYNYYIAGVFVYPLLFHFFTVYPIFVDFKRRKLKIFLIYFYSALLGLPGILPEMFSFLKEQSPVVLILNYTPLLFVVGALIIFIRSYTKIKSPDLKEPLRVLVIGMVIGFIGLIYYYFVFSLFVAKLGLNPVYRLPTMLVLAIPITFGYSIYKYRILDTEFFVKRGIVFTLATGITITAYLLAINLLDTLFDYYQFRNKQLITVLTIILVIFSFSYITKLIKSFVDKRFYKSRYNYRKSLLDFSSELCCLNSIDDVTSQLNTTLRATMGIKNLEVWIKDINGQSDKAMDNVYLYLYLKDKNPKFLFDVNLFEGKFPEVYKRYFKDRGIVLSLPVLMKDTLIGSINLGEKPENSPYTEEDIDLLKTICSNISIVYENSRLRLAEIKKNKIEEELKVAKNIQEGLLPNTNFNFDRLEISCSSQPARIIGGDFYDVIKLDDDKVLVVIADVSGKGLPAALYMAKVQALIRFASRIFKTPKEIISEVNKQVYDKFEKKSFVTVSLGLFDLKTNKVRFIRAGHNPAIFARNGSIELLNTRGIGLGLDRDDLFNKNLDEYEIQLDKESLLLFYTDGLNEAMNSHKEEFGMERLINVVKQNRGLRPAEISNTLSEEVRNFVSHAEQHDDITLVVVKTY
ncbi:MAG: SpoIIE family protein phosphatase [Ignavibacteria bacterium]